MIDYEITIDVRGFSAEKKKRVQVAYFKLGIFWPTERGSYLQLDKRMYTNATVDGDVFEHLMYASIPESRTATHTYEQLMELAGMSEKKEFTVDDLKDGHIITNDYGEVGIVFRDKIYSEKFNANLIDYDGFDVFMGSNSSGCAIVKVETLDGDVLYERDHLIKLCIGTVVYTVSELRKIAESRKPEAAFAKYVLDKEGLS